MVQGKGVGSCVNFDKLSAKEQTNVSLFFVDFSKGKEIR
jgi:hypothetical protein